MIIQNTKTDQTAPAKPPATEVVRQAAPKKMTSQPEKVESKSNTQAVKPTIEQLQEAVSDINSSMQKANLKIQFSVDHESSELVVKVMDSETGDVIRQIPSEETLAISRAIDQFQQGMLLSQKA